MARVSTATVSRALTNPHLRSERTRDAVNAAIRDTGYRGTRPARSLRARRSGAVLIVVPDLGKPLYSGILSGIGDGFAGSGVSVLISNAKNEPIRAETLAGWFLDGRIDGAISLDLGLPRAAPTRCTDHGVSDRIVFLCERVQGAPCPVVASDSVQGARLAVRHLHDRGHRRIAHVTGPAGIVLTDARRAGMLSEYDRLGLPSREELIIDGDFWLEAGYRAAARIHAMADCPTTVFRSVDMVAFGLVSGPKAVGQRVPADIPVVGFDDIEMFGHSVPPLTTIRQDRKRLGRSRGVNDVDKQSWSAPIGWSGFGLSA